MKVKILSIFLLLIMCLTACKVTKEEKPKEKKSIEYAVMKKSELPKAVADYIENIKGERGNTTYTDNGYKYIIVCYGEVDTGGYSISIEEMYETKESVVIKTKLIGPYEGEKVNRTKTYPYIVMKIEDNKKEVKFE